MALAIFKRIPPWGRGLQVYAVGAVVVYSWTLLWFFWKLPSLIDFLNLGEILSAFAYLLTVNFVESLLVLVAPLLLSLILPQKWFCDQFIARGAGLVLAVTGYLIILAFQFQTINGYPDIFLKTWSVAFAAALIAVIVFLVGRFVVLRNALEALADRTTIFLYLTIPLSLIALLAVGIRQVI